MNTKMILFFNIGNRNITYKGKELEKGSLRQQSQQLYENYEREKGQIETQIVNPLIEQFQGNIREIVLLVTDQGRSSYAHQDTLYIGEVVKKKITEKYAIKSVSIKKYEGNPIEFDEIFPYMKRLIKSYEGDGFLKVICNTGGTPQMKQALLLTATNLLTAEEVEAYHVDEKTGAVKPIDLSATLRAEFVKRTCFEFIKKYEYAAAAELLQKNLAPSKEKQIALSLLNYGKHRLTFDFDTANQSLDIIKAHLSSIEFRDIEKLKINIKTRAEKIEELYRNFIIQWEKENYVDFLGRLFRLEEEIYYYFAEKEFEIDLTEIKNHSAFLEKVREMPEIAEKKYKGKPLKMDKVSKPLLFIVLDSIKKYQFMTRKFNKIGNYLAFKGVKGELDDLRNRSIMAHGTAPVSKTIIEESYPEQIDNLFDNFKFVIQQIKKAEEISVNENFDYQYLNEKIKEFLS